MNKTKFEVFNLKSNVRFFTVSVRFGEVLAVFELLLFFNIICIVLKIGLGGATAWHLDFGLGGRSRRQAG